MKIFGINFTTKKELKEALENLRETFPFDLGQTVYDVALKNDKGRYTRKNPAREYCTITEVIVDEKNYFNLVNRFARNDVFTDLAEAQDYLDLICQK